jgi:DNA polymerase alpha subunit B
MGEQPLAELNKFFASGDKSLEPDVVGKLQSIMRHYELSAEDLYYKWESYCIALDMESSSLQIDTLDSFRKSLQDALEKSHREVTQIKTEKRTAATPRTATKGGDVFGMSVYKITEYSER